ncbi:MAG TPA: hypothetical protein VGC70_10630, partial [Burkholderiales bacterium]
MNAHTPEWARWQTEWQRDRSAQEARLCLSPADRRRIRITWVVESVVAVALLLLVILALKHAASAYEARLGFGIGLGIAGVWVQRILIRGREHASDTAAANEYLVAARILAVREMRLAQFIWITLGLELAFLIPWWVIGSRVHSRAITNVGSLLTMWLPILGFALLLA